MKKIFPVVSILLVSLYSSADRIVLKSGSTLIGVVENQDDTTVTLRSGPARLVLKRDEIVSIEMEAEGDNLLRRGRHFFEAGQLDKAETEFHKALEHEDAAEEARSGLQRISALRKKKKEEQIGEVRSRAQSLADKERFVEAVSLLSRFLESEFQERPSLLALRGNIYLKYAASEIDHYRFSAAKDLLVLANADGGSPTRLHQLLGVIDQREGRLSQAYEEFRLARLAMEEERMAQAEPIEEDLNEQLRETELLLGNLPKAQPPERISVLPAEKPPRLWVIIKDAGKKHKVDPLLIEAVISVESDYRADAISPVGAQGLMQLMPGTAKDMGVEDPFDPAQNVEGGAKYLAMMLGMFSGDVERALAAYNAGPHKVKIYGGIPPYKETRAYVPKVLRRYESLKTNGSKLGAG